LAEDRLLSPNERDYREYILIFRQLVTRDESINSSSLLSEIPKLLSFIESIFRSPAIAEVFLYFCLQGAATSWILQNELDMPEATVYRALKRLRSLGVIEPAIRMKKAKVSRGGPRPTVYALLGSSTEEVAGAIRLHHNLLSPKFRIAQEVAQTILKDYITPRQVTEITYREIIIQVRELKIPFSAPDIAGLAADYLKEQGIRVWR